MHRSRRLSDRLRNLQRIKITTSRPWPAEDGLPGFDPWNRVPFPMTGFNHAGCSPKPCGIRMFEDAFNLRRVLWVSLSAGGRQARECSLKVAKEVSVCGGPV